MNLSLIITSMVSLPSWTAVSSRGSMVSSPGKPGGGLALFFSSTAWGAETNHSIRIILLHTSLSLKTLTIKCPQESIKDLYLQSYNSSIKRDCGICRVLSIIHMNSFWLEILPWSVAKQSMMSMFSHRVSWSSAVTRHGLTWPLLWPILSRSSEVKNRWCGATSQVTANPLSLAAFMTNI